MSAYCRTNLRSALLRLLGVLWLWTGPLSAQSIVADASVGRIGIGEVVGGSLGAGDSVLDDGSYFETWAFVLEIPGFITIDLHSSDFDTYLFLALSDDSIIGENDDCLPGDFDHSCLETIPAVADTYYIGVNSFAVGEEGDYTLSVGFEPLAQAPEPSSTLLLLLGSVALLWRRR